jgi:hypothetical protein
MSELAVFQAELERLEREDRWDDPGYDFLVSKVEELQAAEKAKPSAARAPAAAGEPEADLAARMLAMASSPERYSDEQHAAIVAEYNASVVAAGTTQQAQRVDVQALTREMLAAQANPGALTDQQRADLADRYNASIRQGPERRTVSELRADLASTDLAARMQAAAALQQRGELDDATAGEIVDAYNAAVREHADARAALDPDAYPEELREVVEGLRQGREHLERPADPVEAGIAKFNQYVASLKPATVEQQLADLGVEVEQEPEAAQAELAGAES